MHYVYILYSKSTDSYYVGETMDVDNRLDEHNSHRFKGSITRKAADWEVFYLLECESKSQAIKIEKHIKRMKSRKYYQSLKLYPEVSIRLKAKYQ